jgi:hypothetical protein
MDVFTNRKYPELIVFEVGRENDGEDHHRVIKIDLEYMSISVKPVFVAQVTSMN